MTFSVVEKETNKVFCVYDVRNDSVGYPNFLIYDVKQWVWRSAKHFFPKNEQR